MPIIVKFFGEIIKMPKIDNVLYLSLQSLGYGWNDRHQIFLLIFIDNSIFYCRSKEFRNVTLNTVFVISHCLHLLNVLRKTISCKIICNNVSAELGLFSRLSIYTLLQEERNHLHNPPPMRGQNMSIMYTHIVYSMYMNIMIW